MKSSKNILGAEHVKHYFHVHFEVIKEKKKIK